MPDVSSSPGGGRRLDRQSRSRLQLTEQITPQQAAPNVVRRRPAQVTTQTGLEGLKGSLSNFFRSASNAVDVVNQVEHAKDVQDIDRENQTQRQEAVRRALAGEDLTTDQRQDLDYTEAYSEALGRQNGMDLAQTFISEVAPTVNLMDDIEQVAENFLMENLQNGDQFGVGTAAYDVQLLSAFNEATRNTRVSHRVSGTQAQLDQGVAAHDASIVSNFTSISAEDIPRLIQERRDLMPLDPNGAPAAVMNALIVAAGSQPAKATRVMQMLNDPQSGREGRTFAQLYPEAAEEIEDRLVEQYLHGKSLEASMMYREILNAAAFSDDPAELAFILDTVMGDMHEQYGLGGGWDQTFAAVNERYDALAQGIVDRNRYIGMVYQGDIPDPAFLRENQESVLQQLGINPLENPRGAGDFVSRAGVINGNLKDMMSRALTDMTEPSEVAAAVNFYHAIEQRDGWDFAKSMISPEARAGYQYMRDRMVLRGIDPVELVESYNRNRSTITEAEAVSWKDLTGSSTVADGREQLSRRIAEGFSEQFGETVELTAQAENALMNMVRLEAVQRGNVGAAHWKDTVDDVLDSVEGLQVYPGEGFVGRVGRNQLVAGMTMIPSNPDQPGFGDHRNPQTGETENTLDIYRDDMRALVDLFNDSPNMADLDSDHVRVSGNSPWAPLGVWTLLHGDDPMMLIPGETLTIGGQELLIPEDPHMAANLLAEFPWGSLPGMQQDEQGVISEFLDGERRVAQHPHERLQLIPYPAEDPIGYMLGYKPGFRWRMPTVAEREAAYQTPEDRNPEAAARAAEMEADQQAMEDMRSAIIGEE